MSNRLSPDTAVQKAQAFRPIEVFDAETDAIVTRDEDQQRQAHTLMRAVEAATLVKAVALARIMDKKHFLDFGCSTFKEFADRYLPVGYRSAKNYIQIGRKFAPMMPEFQGTEGNPSSLLPGETPENGEIMEVGGLGYKKLLKLTRVEDAVFTDVVEEGKLVMPDGQEFTIEELREMAVREFSDKLEEARMTKDAYRARVQQLEEEKKLLESEMKTEQQRIEDAECKLQKAEELEKLYGPAARRYDDVEAQLKAALDHALQLRRHLFNAEVEDTDSPVLIDLCQQVVREVLATGTRARSYYADVLALAEDDIALAEAPAMIDEVFAEIEAEDNAGDIQTEGQIPATEKYDEETVFALQDNGWVLQSRPDPDGFTEWRLLNETTGIYTEWWKQLDYAIKHALHLDDDTDAPSNVVPLGGGRS